MKITSVKIEMRADGSPFPVMEASIETDSLPTGQRLAVAQRVDAGRPRRKTGDLLVEPLIDAALAMLNELHATARMIESGRHEEESIDPSLLLQIVARRP